MANHISEFITAMFLEPQQALHHMDAPVSKITYCPWPTWGESWSKLYHRMRRYPKEQKKLSRNVLLSSSALLPRKPLTDAARITARLSMEMISVVLWRHLALINMLMPWKDICVDIESMKGRQPLWSATSQFKLKLTMNYRSLEAVSIETNCLSRVLTMLQRQGNFSEGNFGIWTERLTCIISTIWHFLFFSKKGSEGV